jgi:hypothetical protein
MTSESFNFDSEHVRKGVRWTAEEDEELMNKSSSRVNIEDISKYHKRTVKAVQMRIMRNIVSKIKAGESMESLTELYHVSPQEIETYIEEQEEYEHKRTEKKKQANAKIEPCLELKYDPTSRVIELLIEIRDLLRDIQGIQNE